MPPQPEQDQIRAQIQVGSGLFANPAVQPARSAQFISYTLIKFNHQNKSPRALISDLVKHIVAWCCRHHTFSRALVDDALG